MKPQIHRSNLEPSFPYIYKKSYNLGISQHQRKFVVFCIFLGIIHLGDTKKK